MLPHSIFSFSKFSLRLHFTEKQLEKKEEDGKQTETNAARPKHSRLKHLSAFGERCSNCDTEKLVYA